MLEKSVRDLQSVIQELETKLESVDKERTEVSKALGLARDAFAVLTRGRSNGADGPHRSHAGKYKPLFDYLRKHDREGRLMMTFKQIEHILGFPLPPSSRKHLPHWHSYEGSAVVRAIHDAGWRAHNVDLQAEHVELRIAEAAQQDH